MLSLILDANRFFEAKKLSEPKTRRVHVLEHELDEFHEELDEFGLQTAYLRVFGWNWTRNITLSCVWTYKLIF